MYFFVAKHNFAPVLTSYVSWSLKFTMCSRKRSHWLCVFKIFSAWTWIRLNPLGYSWSPLKVKSSTCIVDPGELPNRHIPTAYWHRTLRLSHHWKWKVRLVLLIRVNIISEVSVIGIRYLGPKIIFRTCRRGEDWWAVIMNSTVKFILYWLLTVTSNGSVLVLTFLFMIIFFIKSTPTPTYHPHQIQMLKNRPTFWTLSASISDVERSQRLALRAL